MRQRLILGLIALCAIIGLSALAVATNFPNSPSPAPTPSPCISVPDDTDQPLPSGRVACGG